MDAWCCVGQWSMKPGLGCPLVPADQGEPRKRLGLGMPARGPSELWSYCFAGNAVPDCEVICVSDLEVFVWEASPCPFVGGWLCGSVRARVGVPCERTCVGLG